MVVFAKVIFKKLLAVRFYGVRLEVRSHSDVVTPYFIAFSALSPQKKKAVLSALSSC